jgi:hypothetical protein
MAIINVHNYKSREEAIKLVSELDLSKVHQVKVTCKRGKRSIDQNALYWMWLTCIEQETGNEKNDLHFHFKGEYLIHLTKKINILGIEKYRLISTSELDTLQFTQYLEKIQIFANTELGINLPNPSDLEFERFKDYYSKFI